MSGRAGTAIALGALLIAGPPLFAENGWAGDTAVSVATATGTDSNVFLSKNDPRSSTFLQTTFKALWETDPARAQRLSWTTHGLYKHYLRFGEADKVFADSIIAYRYAATPSLLFGLIESASYTRLQLLDTEGNTMPRDRFSAYANEIRGYLQTLPARGSRLTLGGGVRRTDVRETATLLSLDHQGYFTTFEAGIQRGSTAAGLMYEYAVTHYDESQANDRNMTLQSTNPLLTLIQHTVRARLGGPLVRWIGASGEGQMRWTIDPFEGDLTYRQLDGKTQWDVALWRFATWSNAVSYRTRIYAERVSDSGDSDRRERFLTLTSLLRRPWTQHVSSTLQYQINRKSSNLTIDQFTLQTFSLGLEVIF